jgi:glucose/mannose-6-phosphate isomerase
MPGTANELSAASEALDDEQKYLERATRLLLDIESSLPAKIVVVTDYFTNPIGLRFCQQIQENAKSEAFLHELPESNHNVIESYYGKLNSIFFFINSQNQPRTGLRFRFLKGVLEENGNTVQEINLNSTGLADVLETIYVLDWLSLLIADHKAVNSSLIKNINALKDYLSAN